MVDRRFKGERNGFDGAASHAWTSARLRLEPRLGPPSPFQTLARYIYPGPSDHRISRVTAIRIACIGMSAASSSAIFRPTPAVTDTSDTGPLSSRRPTYGSSWKLWRLSVIAEVLPLEVVRKAERNLVHCRRRLRKGVIVGRLAETSSTAGSIRDQSPTAVESRVL